MQTGANSAQLWMHCPPVDNVAAYCAVGAECHIRSVMLDGCDIRPDETKDTGEWRSRSGSPVTERSSFRGREGM